MVISADDDETSHIDQFGNESTLESNTYIVQPKKNRILKLNSKHGPYTSEEEDQDEPDNSSTLSEHSGFKEIYDAYDSILETRRKGRGMKTT